MNTPSPLIPQGTLPARGKSTFFFKVLMILTVHVVLIGGMLLQGCKDTKDTSTTTDTTTPATDTLPPVTTTNNLNPATGTAQTPPPAAPQNPVPVSQQTPQTAVTSAPPAVPIAPPVVVTPPPVTAPATEAKEYVIASGDTLGAIAHKNGVSLKALMDANAGVNPKKLQIGQKIQIPAGTSAVASTPAAVSPDVAAATGDATVYVVKSGDTLSKIAKVNHTTVKKIMALNDLKTSSIKVAQKLKMPAPKMAGAETPATPAASAPIVPLSTPPAATTTAAAPSTTSSN